ncbi:MAG: class I SAM-dependent methyltransferase [Desulfobacterales bacterium]|nr:class I SAM-dependent methyltransferase [Desulfobacterales bacterium]
MAIDLGCGDGRILRAAADRLRIHAVGYEVNPLASLKCRILCLFHRNIDVRCRNFWHADLSGADLVFCYLYPDVLKKAFQKTARRTPIRSHGDFVQLSDPRVCALPDPASRRRFTRRSDFCILVMNSALPNS